MDTNELNIRVTFSRRGALVALAAFFLCWHPGFIGSESLQLTTYYPAPYGGYVSILTTGNTLLARDGGANTLVGIGIALPNSKLHVHGVTQVTDGNATADTSAYGTFGVTRGAVGNTPTYIAMTRQGNVVKAMGIDGGNRWVFGLPQAGTQNINSPQMYIEQGGNVGIGVVPDWNRRLHVNGSVRVQGDLQVDGNILNVCARRAYGTGGTTWCPAGYNVVGYYGDGGARVQGFLPASSTTSGVGTYIVLGQDWGGTMVCCKF